MRKCVRVCARLGVWERVYVCLSACVDWVRECVGEGGSVSEYTSEYVCKGEWVISKVV